MSRKAKPVKIGIATSLATFTDGKFERILGTDARTNAKNLKSRIFCHTDEQTNMAFSPDIIVTGGTGEDTPRILLMAEAKRYPTIRKEDEFQLKSYMVHMRCPIGLLVTPNAIEVFRDTYTAHSESSVERVGSFPAPTDWDIFRVPHHGSSGQGASDTNLGFQFEEAVKFWLEQLATSPSPYLPGQSFGILLPTEAPRPLAVMEPRTSTDSSVEDNDVHSSTG